MSNQTSDVEKSEVDDPLPHCQPHAVAMARPRWRKENARGCGHKRCQAPRAKMADDAAAADDDAILYFWTGHLVVNELVRPTLERRIKKGQTDIADSKGLTVEATRTNAS